MLTVVWVSPFSPDHHGGGGQLRQAYLLDALARVASVHLVCPGPVSDPAVRAAVSGLTMTNDPPGWRAGHRWLRRAADLVASVASPQPIEVRGFAPVRRVLRRALRPIIAAGGADVVMVEYAGLAPLLPRRHRRGRRRGRPGARWVLTLHNLPSRMAAQQAAVADRHRQRWLLRRDAGVARRLERRAARSYDAVIVCTPEDAAAVGTGHIQVVPNGADLRRRPAPLPAEPRIVFTGALYTSPNVDGAVWFCRHVFPLVQAEVPAATLAIVGARPVPEVAALAGVPGVEVHADVADVAPFLDAARVAAVPLRIGSGSRLKALEAMAAGRPVVGTTLGLEGLGLTAGREALVADDAPGLAAGVVRVLSDDGLAACLAGAGRQAVQERFGWDDIAAPFVEQVVALADARQENP